MLVLGKAATPAVNGHPDVSNLQFKCKIVLSKPMSLRITRITQKICIKMQTQHWNGCRSRWEEGSDVYAPERWPFVCFPSD